MKKKLIITEGQMTRLKQRIVEMEGHTAMVNKIKEELDANYKPIGFTWND